MAFVLAAQLFAWTMIVFVPLALSPFAAVTRTSTRAWLVAAAAVAVGSWTVAGRPVPPVAHLIAVLRHALGDPLIAVLGAVCAVALLYVVALATLTPENEGDALAYHVARAAFWYQQHSVRYVENAVETRLNVNPPNAELGVLFTMLASGTQRSLAWFRSARRSRARPPRPGSRDGSDSASRRRCSAASC